MKLFLTFLILFLPYTLSAASSEDAIKSAVLGKFTHFVKQKNPIKNPNFIILVFKDEKFASLVEKKYAHKLIQHKNVLVKHVNQFEDIKIPNLLYIGAVPHEEQQKLLKYAHQNSLFSVSSQSGFAQRGGIIQLYFLSQKIRFKINLDAAKKSNLKISASLLSISTIVKGITQ